MISIWISYTKLSRVTSYNVYKLDGNFSATFLYVTMSCQAKLGLEKKTRISDFIVQVCSVARVHLP